MYTVEVLFPKAPCLSSNFGTAKEALEFYEMVRGLTNHCVKVLIFERNSKLVEPALLAECLMQWDKADKLRKG